MKWFPLILMGLLAGSSSAQAPWSLEQCIAFAFENNLQIRQAELGAETAEIGQTEAMGAFLPTVNGQASHGYNWGQTIDPFTNTFATSRIRSNQVGLNTGLTLFNGFNNLNNMKLSQSELARSEADLEAAQNAVALSIAQAYLTILLNEEFLNVARGNYNGTQQQVDRIRTLVEAGQLPDGNLADIEAQLYLDEASMINAQNQVDLAYLSLTQQLQLPPDQTAGFSIDKPDPDAFGDVALIPSAEAAVNHAVNQFPEIRSAESGVLSAEYSMALAKAGRYPSLFANYSYGSGYSGANQRGVGEPIFEEVPIGITETSEELVISGISSFNDFETTPFMTQLRDNVNQSLFFSLQVPIFNGFRVESQVKRAQISMESATIGLEQQRQGLTQDVERAYADAKAAQKNVAASQRALEATQKAFGYAEIRFEQGVINTVDFNDARIRRDNAQADLIRNRYDYVFKAKVLDFYMGKPITLR